MSEARDTPAPRRSSRTDEEILEGLRPYGRTTRKSYSIRGKEQPMYAVGELAKALNRRSGTIRKWEELGILPKAPAMLRGDGTYANRRLYSAAHVVGIVKIAEEEGVLDMTNTRNIRDTRFRERVLELFQELQGGTA